MRELPEGSISFAEAAERYLAWRGQLFRPNTVKNDRVALNRFEKAVGEGWYLDEITPDIGSASLQYVRGTVAETTANQYYAQMRVILALVHRRGTRPAELQPVPQPAVSQGSEEGVRAPPQARIPCLHRSHSEARGQDFVQRRSLPMREGQ